VLRGKGGVLMLTTSTATGTGALDDSGVATGSSGTSGTSGSTADGSSGATSSDDGLVCTSIYAPVCGKDGETYDHPCDAIAAGVEIRRDGPCLGDCEGSCGVASRAPSLLGLLLVVLACLRPRRRIARA
jgi:Kazal-type serine protease inhibitor domain